MALPPFLLDDWLERYRHAAIAHDLASSTGVTWTLAEILALAPERAETWARLPLNYASAEGDPGLRAAVAALYSAAPDDVLITTGASEALHAIFASVAERGANVVVPFPAFPPLLELPALHGLEVRSYRLRAERGFALDLDELAGLLDARTKLLLVNTPHNPTGTVLSREELQAVSDLALSRGVALVADEVYWPLYHRAEPHSAAALPQATVVGSLSKAASVSGLRVGWILERDPRRRARTQTARMYFTISNSPLAEFLATAVLRDHERLVAATRARAQANLALLARFAEEQRERLELVVPQGGTTAFPKLRFTADSRPFCEALARAGALAAPGDCFGLPAHLRVGFGHDEGFGQALALMGEVLEAASRAAA